MAMAPVKKMVEKEGGKKKEMITVEVKRGTTNKACKWPPSQDFIRSIHQRFSQY
jgi:hypothetical protein